MIDLHAHSSVSDGTDSPAALIQKAADSGLAAIALTDHDTTSGWIEASLACEVHGLEFVPGIELTVRDGSDGHHLLGYWPDPSASELADILDRLVASRVDRTPQIVARLAELDLVIDEAEIRRIAGDAVIGKPHLAEAMVAAGHVASIQEAVDLWLKKGRPAYVGRWAPTIEDAVVALRAAGGVPVLAHPRARGSAIGEERFAQLQELGLGGIEVDHQMHTPDVRTELRAIATNLGLVATGSSDHHGLRKVDHDLGCNTTAPDQYEALKEMAGLASGRRL